MSKVSLGARGEPGLGFLGFPSGLSGVRLLPLGSRPFLVLRLLALVTPALGVGW